MKYFKVGINILLILIFFQRCANPGVVSGGPKDTIPPVLLSSYPVDQTLNFNDKTLILEFNERIAADKIKQNLIISPTTKVKFKHFIKKNTITLLFEEPFQDTTTYTFNFFDAITDITEKNPPVNLVLAFSTGDFIDSLKVFGTVKDLMTDKRLEKATVALYAKTDSTNIFEDTPTYFTSTTKNGSFAINNIKYGLYKLIAFEDANKNLSFDEDEEQYAFQTGNINPVNLTDSLRFYSYQIDASELKVNSARISGRYYEMRYSKQISNYEILDTDSVLTINSSLSEDRETLRFYNPFQGYPKDSIRVIIEAIDSLKNTTVDTTYIKFQESSRKKVEFAVQANPTSTKTIKPEQSLLLSFTKPVKTWDLSKFKVVLDSMNFFYLQNIDIKWNHNYTEALLPQLIKRKELLDSIALWDKTIQIDSLNPDTLDVIRKNLLSKYDTYSYQLNIGEQSFISIEEDTLSALDLKYKFPNTENMGTMTVNVKSDSLQYFIQLISAQKKEVHQQLYSCSTCRFTDIPPGKYTLRFLIDSNKDSIWSIGNIRKDLPSEPVKHFPKETEVRSNFDMLLDISL